MSGAGESARVRVPIYCDECGDELEVASTFTNAIRVRRCWCIATALDAVARERDEVSEALLSVLEDRKPDGRDEYVHLLICSGDRRKPAGADGCVCLRSKKSLAHEAAALRERVAGIERELTEARRGEAEAVADRSSAEAALTQAREEIATLKREREEWRERFEASENLRHAGTEREVKVGLAFNRERERNERLEGAAAPFAGIDLGAGIKRDRVWVLAEDVARLRAALGEQSMNIAS